MQEFTLGRRDDLISLAYMMLYLAKGNMSFLVDDETMVLDFNYMREAKSFATPQSLC